MKYFATTISLIGCLSSLVFLGAGETVDLATDASKHVQILGVDIGDNTGIRIASCDINGDGLDDLIIGANAADGIDNLSPNIGEAYIVYGRRGAWPLTLSLEFDTDVHIRGQGLFDDFGLSIMASFVV